MQTKERNNWRTMLLAGSIAFLVSVGASTAVAASSSVKSVGTFVGYSYTNQAILNNLGVGNLRSFTNAKVNIGPPASYYGAQPRTWSSEILCASGPMSYNAASVVSIIPSVDGICDPGVVHYGAGRSTHWDGSAYITVSTYNTPNVTP